MRRISPFRIVMIMAACGSLGFADEVGQELSLWVPGTMEIHQISTGRGNSGLYIFPDGTTLLVDAGEMIRKNERHTPDRPDGTRRAGEWITRYIRHALRHDPKPALDYALLTHFHEDHIGEGTQDSPLASNGAYRLSGITEVGDKLPIRTLLDRGWPEYSFPAPQTAGFITNYRAFVTWKIANAGLKAEAFRPGRNDQVTLRRNAKAYPEFEFRNLGANGIIWTGAGKETRSCIPPLDTLPRGDWPDENLLSISFRIRYGAFTYFNGGDIRGVPYPGAPEWHDLETPIAKVAGPVDAAILNHHGYLDSMNATFVSALQARVWVISVWDSAHPTGSVFQRLLSSRLYPGPRDLFVTDLHEGARLVIGGIEKRLASAHGHIVIRVAPGGKEYRVLIVDDTNESHRITKISGPYTSKGK